MQDRPTNSEMLLLNNQAHSSRRTRRLVVSQSEAVHRFQRADRILFGLGLEQFPKSTRIRRSSQSQDRDPLAEWRPRSRSREMSMRRQLRGEGPFPGREREISDHQGGFFNTNFAQRRLDCFGRFARKQTYGLRTSLCLFF
jgi:hypothetical protein